MFTYLENELLDLLQEERIEMSKLKLLITTKENYKRIRKLVDNKTFEDKFDVRMDVVSQLLADECLIRLCFVDSRMAEAEDVRSLRHMGIMLN